MREKAVGLMAFFFGILGTQQSGVRQGMYIVRKNALSLRLKRSGTKLATAPFGLRSLSAGVFGGFFRTIYMSCRAPLCCCVLSRSAFCGRYLYPSVPFLCRPSPTPPRAESRGAPSPIFPPHFSTRETLRIPPNCAMLLAYIEKNAHQAKGGTT